MLAPSRKWPQMIPQKREGEVHKTKKERRRSPVGGCPSVGEQRHFAPEPAGEDAVHLHVPASSSTSFAVAASHTRCCDDDAWTDQPPVGPTGESARASHAPAVRCVNQPMPCRRASRSHQAERRGSWQRADRRHRRPAVGAWRAGQPPTPPKGSAQQRVHHEKHAAEQHVPEHV